jgi:hypothetical protein
MFVTQGPDKDLGNPVKRVSRFEMIDDAIDKGSEQVLVEDIQPQTATTTLGIFTSARTATREAYEQEGPARRSPTYGGSVSLHRGVCYRAQ